MQQQFARHIGPTGEVRPFIARDLGNLRDRPPAPRATLLWRARNWVAHKHRGAVPHAAALIVGRLLDVVTVRAALSAVTYRPDLSRLDVHQLQRLAQQGSFVANRADALATHSGASEPTQTRPDPAR